MEKKFNTVQKSIDLSCLYLEELLRIDLTQIDKSEKEFLFSQLERVIKVNLSVLKHG